MIRVSTGETQVPAPPKVPAPEDFPVVPTVEPPRLDRSDQMGLAAAITVAIAVAIGLKWLSGGTIESAPILFVAAVAAAWWLDRRAAIGVAIVSETAWTAAAFAAGPMVGTAVSAIALGAGLIAIVVFVSAARARDRALRIEALRREQARMILAVQLRESVVSIDVAVPLLADPMKLDRAQGAAFDQVRRHARGLTRLAKHLLSAEPMDTRKMALTMVPVDLAAFVVEITEQRVPHDRATIVAPSTPVQALADPQPLRPPPDHLLQNALEFSPPNAGIT